MKLISYILLGMIIFLIAVTSILLQIRYNGSKFYIDKYPNTIYSEYNLRYSCELGVVYLKQKKGVLVDSNGKPRTCTFVN